MYNWQIDDYFALKINESDGLNIERRNVSQNFVSVQKGIKIRFDAIYRRFDKDSRREETMNPSLHRQSSCNWQIDDYFSLKIGDEQWI